MRFGTWMAGLGTAIGVGALALAFSSGDGTGRNVPPAAMPAPSPALMQEMTGPAVIPVPVAQPRAQNPQAQPADADPTAEVAPNFIPSEVQLYEAHWQGMDVKLLTEEIRRKLKYPRGLEGVLVGEVTLNAARAGLLGGDVIISIDEDRVTTLEQFQQGSRNVRNAPQVSLSVLRKTDRKEDGRFAMKRLVVVLRGNPDLGFAQVEAAPMILAGSPRPHPYRGACTKCHAVGEGFELAPDPDMITLPPPPLSREVVDKGAPPHEDRGPCEACHLIKG